MSIFSERVSELMKRQRLSQKLLAEKAGVTEPAMSLYVRGKRTPRGDVLARIARALGTKSDYLLGINDTVSNDEDKLSYLLRNLGKLDEAELKKAETVLKAVFNDIFDDDFTAPKENKGFCIEIPENATNGDMVKAMFPNELLTSITSTLWWGDNMSFSKEWWNAPYKAERKE